MAKLKTYPARFFIKSLALVAVGHYRHTSHEIWKWRGFDDPVVEECMYRARHE